MKRHSILCDIAFLLVLANSSNCHAVLNGYDGFDYTAGSGIIGETGGSGWANAWSGSTPSAGVGSRSIQAPGATYPSLQTVGNKAFIAATNQTQRTLSAGVQGTGDETVWISFIGQRVGADTVRFFGLSFYEGTTASGNERFTIGEPSDNSEELWGAHFTSTAQGRAAVAGSAVTTEALLFVRVDYHAAVNDDLYLWVNPTLSAGEPSVGTAGASSIGAFNLAFDIVSMRAGTLRTSDNTHGEAFFDEIRIGTSFADVAPGGGTFMEGDFEEDNDVDNVDLSRWITNYGLSGGATHGQGNADGDGDVDGTDFLIWQRQRNSPSAILLANSVPELSSHGLFFMAIVGLRLYGARRLHS